MSVIFNLFITNVAEAQPCTTAIRQLLSELGYQVVVSELADVMSMIGIKQSETEAAPLSGTMVTPPAQLPAAGGEEVQTDAPPAETTAGPAVPSIWSVPAVPAAPVGLTSTDFVSLPATLPLSFAEAVIMNLDAARAVPVTYDPNRDHSVLMVAARLTEDNCDKNYLKFKFGSTTFTVPAVDDQHDVVENVGENPQFVAFRALIKPVNSSSQHSVRLGIEIDEGSRAEQLVFGRDLATLIISTGDSTNAGVS